MQYLYLIRCQQFYKIGIANDVQSRLAQLSTGNPFELELIITYGFRNASAVESVLHQRLSTFRRRGEWFELSDVELKLIAQICSLLGGLPVAQGITTVDEQEVAEAEEIQEAVMDDEGEWDYAAMFADGWRMEKTSGKGQNDKYWSWRKGSFRKGSTTKAYLYGGRIADLPYPDLETMRRIYRDGGQP